VTVIGLASITCSASALVCLAVQEYNVEEARAWPLALGLIGLGLGRVDCLVEDELGGFGMQ
jgi:hypothetical protein